MNLYKNNIAVVTHRSIMPCIPGDDLRKFLLANKCNKILYITHPLLLLEESYKLTSHSEFYVEGKLKESMDAMHWNFPEPILYLKDFIYTILWTLKTKEKYDLFIGINNLNALAGVILKKLGKAKKVVYYTIDLYPDRFNNKIINWLYHKLDKFCVRNCDETWNVSPYLAEYRKNNWNVDYPNQITVPIGIWFNEMKRVSTSKVKSNKIAYVGHLKSFYGVDLAINAFPDIKKEIPSAYLEIVGGGEQMEELQDLAKKLKVDESIKFLGWKDKKEAEEIISDASVGLAPFNIDIIDEKVKNGDPAKIKDYLALGLPIAMTNASLNAQAIAKAKCGIVIDKYDSKLYAEAIIKLMENKKLRKEYSDNALSFAKQFDWNKLFSKNISRLI